MDDELHSPKSPPVEDDFQSTLRSAPSFEIYNTSHGEFGDDENYPGVVLRRRESFGSGEFSFGGRKRMDLIEEGENEIDGPNGIQNLSVEEEEEEEDVVDLEPPSPPMYLAAGLGADATGFDAAGVGYDNCASDDIFTPNLQESEDLEKYYKRMVDEYPCHPLILKKYAQLLQVSYYYYYLWIFLLFNQLIHMVL